MKTPILKFHEKSCLTCRYYRQQRGSRCSDCLLLGRTLSIATNAWHDRARFCAGWKRRPKTWDYVCDNNPFRNDQYISRKTQLSLRKKYGII